MRLHSVTNETIIPCIIILFHLVITIPASDTHTRTPDHLSSDLASMLQNPPIQQREVLSNALRIIHSMESSPSCNRLAALTLINSCQSLELSAKSSINVETRSELILDAVKSEYAARLAVCELISAKANIPRDCSVFVPSSYGCAKFRFRSLFTQQESHSQNELCYPEASTSQFGQCLQALESKPQWWTSYSNARQNAVVMCQASRDAIERDEKLSLYKSLAEVTSDIASALAKSVQEAQTQLAEQMAFAEQVRGSQAQALSDLKQGRSEALSALSRLMVDMQSGIQNMINTMFQAWMTAEAQVDKLNETLRLSRISLHETREGILNLFKDVANANSEHTASQIQQWQLGHESALEVQQTLDLVRTNQLHLLSETLASLRNELYGSSELVTQMYQRQNLLDQRLVNLDATFEALEVTAINLRSTVDETTDKIQQMAIFSGIGVALGPWGGIIFVIVGIWFASKPIGGCLATITGIIWLLHTAGFLQWVCGVLDQLRQSAFTCTIAVTAYASKFPDSITLMLEGLLALLGFCLVALSAGSVYLRFVKDDQGEVGILPKIEASELPANTTASPRRHSIPFFSVFSSTIRSYFAR
ncbi:hypothetical protein AOQ84DRAFT_47348 [Glonium stellatum]|uniref:Nuclear fusion protein KAR5 n=1 Tax=Glonium stellatum TaxID=574774 RepID=A0A8E2F0A3_9PEZI|nr:hypothetical protein AOQ84DRAFT_47348 [Glonium stellatum]